MKLFWFFAAVAIAQEVDDLGNKKNKNDVDKVQLWKEFKGVPHKNLRLLVDLLATKRYVGLFSQLSSDWLLSNVVLEPIGFYQNHFQENSTHKQSIFSNFSK